MDNELHALESNKKKVVVSIGTIGHVDHGKKTLVHAITELLSDKKEMLIVEDQHTIKNVIAGKWENNIYLNQGYRRRGQRKYHKRYE